MKQITFSNISVISVILTFVAVAAILTTTSGCTPTTNQDHENRLKTLPIIKLEGCEYIMSYNAHGNVFTHKGNCSNPIHVYNVIEKEEPTKETVKKQALAKLTAQEKEALGIKE